MTDSVRHLPITPRTRLEDRLLHETERFAPRLAALARDLHRHPEPAYHELHSVARLAGELEEEGFDVDVGVAGLPTALRASAGPPNVTTIGFLIEYDAIPVLGHAAGHNLLAAAGVAAGVALSRLLGELHGRVVVCGAPAEETIGGKVVLAMRGAFDGIDAALLAHPAQEDRVIVDTLASWLVEVVFHGRSAHAVAAPEEGINALDAMIQLFVARDALLKSLRPDVRMPGVILDGGLRPNLIPDRARARFSLRAARASYLVGTVFTRFRELVDGIAKASGTTATVTPIDNLFDELISNGVLAETYTTHARRLGIEPNVGAGRVFGSLDIGTVSHRLPVLHPLFRIGDGSVFSHTAAFTELAGSDAAIAATGRAAQVLALTGLSLLTDPARLARVRAEHAAHAARFEREDVPLIDQPVGE